MRSLTAKDCSMALNWLAKVCHEDACVNGWYEQERGDPELLCLIHSEVSECLEELRAGNPTSDTVPGFTAAELELADIIIRVCDMAAFNEWRLGDAVIAKLEYNRTRGHRHGGKVD